MAAFVQKDSYARALGPVCLYNSHPHASHKNDTVEVLTANGEDAKEVPPSPMPIPSKSAEKQDCQQPGEPVPLIPGDVISSDARKSFSIHEGIGLFILYAVGSLVWCA